MVGGFGDRGKWTGWYFGLTDGLNKVGALLHAMISLPTDQIVLNNSLITRKLIPFDNPPLVTIEISVNTVNAKQQLRGNLNHLAVANFKMLQIKQISN